MAIYPLNGLRSMIATGRSFLRSQIPALLVTFFMHSAYAQHPPETINVLLPGRAHASIYNSSFILCWKPTLHGAAVYSVVVKNLYEETLLKVETSETSVHLDWTDPKIAEVDALLVEVQVKGYDNTRSMPNLVRKLSNNARIIIDNLIAAEPDATKENPSSMMAMASFYEAHHLLIDALTCYQRAMLLEPDAVRYRETYHAFLVRNKIDVGE